MKGDDAQVVYIVNLNDMKRTILLEMDKGERGKENHLTMFNIIASRLLPTGNSLLFRIQESKSIRGFLTEVFSLSVLRGIFFT